MRSLILNLRKKFQHFNSFAWVLCFSSSVLISCSLSKQEVKHPTHQIDSLVKNYADAHLFSGVVLVAKEGDVIFQKGFGHSNLEWDVPNRQDSKFLIGSITKSFTATLVMQLVQKGSLRLDDNIGLYLKNLPEDLGDQITIHQLLCNTSGIKNFFEIPGFDSGAFNTDFEQSEFINAIVKMPLAFKPGDDYLYSNSGYYLLGLIIEKVTSLTFEQALKNYIFEPLNMVNSGIYSNEIIVKKMASGYRISSKGGFREQDQMNYKLFDAAGNMYSTAEDLLKFDQALYTESLLTEGNKETLFSPDLPCGWYVGDLSLNNDEIIVPLVGYNGQMKGYSSILGRFIDKKYCIIILSNNGTGYAFKSKLLQEIASVLYGIKLKNEKPQLSFILNKAIILNKLDEVVSKITSKRDEFVAEENLMEDLAQQYYLSGLIEESLVIRKINYDIHSNSVNAILRLAELNLEVGSKEESLKLYKEVLRFQPSNVEAIAFIEKLQ